MAVLRKDFFEGKQEAQKALNELRQTILPLKADSLLTLIEEREETHM